MPKEEEQVELCILAKEASALKKKLEDERQRVNDASCKCLRSTFLYFEFLFNRIRYYN